MIATDLSNDLLDLVLGAQSYTSPSTIYVGLSTTAPAADGTNISEPSGFDYAPVAVTNNATNWPAASGGVKRNGTAIQFPTATGSWGFVTHFVLKDQDDNFLGAGALVDARNVNVADQPRFDANELAVTIS